MKKTSYKLFLFIIILGFSCGRSASPDLAYQGDAFADEGHSRVLLRVPQDHRNEPGPGIVLPYSLDAVISTFSDCRSGGRTHQGLDLAGVGENYGLGTIVRSMVRARITMIGRPEEDSERFGRPDRRSGTTERGGQMLPRSLRISGYGRVNFFTRNYGSWHSGTIIVTEGVGEPLSNHTIRYMHLGAIHLDLRVGDMIEAGQEIGLMGGTAIMDDRPHVHIDIETPQENRLDVAPFLGLPGDPGRCQR